MFSEEIIERLKQNDDALQRILTEKICSSSQEITTTTNIQNIENNIETNVENVENMETHNHFNLQFFLNETCKNAINMSDFIKSIVCNLQDVIDVGKKGYVAGMTDIIIRNLNMLEQNERPMHCSDLKRQSMYIKDDNVWNKDDEQQTRTHDALTAITKINSRSVPLYKAKHPDCCKSDSRYSDEYDNIIVEAMGGKHSTMRLNQDKIIRNITKVITIDKSLVVVV
jgi:hypothetical protein